MRQTLVTPNSSFDGYITRLWQSRNRLQRRSIYFGQIYPHDYPVLLDSSLLCEHAHILGAPGSGKTSRSLMPLQIQLIRRGDGPVIIFDLKGDMALFNTARIEAERAGRKFKWFTNMANRSTYVFNPWDPEVLSKMTVQEILGLVTQSLNLYHGDDYGAGWFSANTRILLKRAIEQTLHTKAVSGRLFASEPPIESYGDLHKILKKLATDNNEFKAAQHLAFIVEQLASYPQLNLAPRSNGSDPSVRHAIHMPEVIRENQVIYFYLPGAFDASAAGEIVRLALFTLLAAARDYREEHGHPCRADVIIDEAQVIVAKNIENILAQARSYGVACIMAHQSMNQLNPSGGADLRELFMNCTTIKQFFTARDPWLMRYIAEMSGQTKYYHLGYETGYDPVAENDVSLWRANFRDGQILAQVSEEYGPRLSTADIIDYSQNPAMSMVSIGGDSAICPYHGWFPMQTSWPISYREYCRRQSEIPWPEANEETITVASDWPTDDAGPGRVVSDPAVSAGKQLREILKELRPTEKQNNDKQKET